MTNTKSVGIFQVTEDVKYNSLFATYKLKLLKNIKSTHPLQVGNTIDAYTFDSPCLDANSVSAVYKSSNITPLLRKNECYLLVYGDPAGPGTLKHSALTWCKKRHLLLSGLRNTVRYRSAPFQREKSDNDQTQKGI